MSTPGWYADPLARAELRWYNGGGWGDQVRAGGAEGQDPLDTSGRPLWPGPRWGPVPQPLSPQPRSALPPPVGPAPGRGTTVAIVVVALITVVLLVAGAIAVLVLIRNAPTLTGEQIEAQVGAELSAQVGGDVRLDCPAVTYAGSADGMIECAATGGVLRAPVRVEVVIRDARVRRWEVLPAFEPGASA